MYLARQIIRAACRAGLRGLLGIGLLCGPAYALGDREITASGGVASGRDMSNNNINISKTVYQQDPNAIAEMAKIMADRIAASAEAKAQAEAKRDQFAEKWGFTREAVVEVFKILGEQNVPEEKAPARLIEIASQYAATRDKLAALEPDDPHTAGLARQAKAALDTGRLA